MVYNAANSQQSNTYQYTTDQKVRKLFEVPTYIRMEEHHQLKSIIYLILELNYNQMIGHKV